jgi:NADH-quinone oxidoreductase subunit H
MPAVRGASLGGRVADLIDLLIIIAKAAIVLGALLHLALFVIWVERKGSALIQNRIGANRASILGFDLAGVLNTLVADPVKALTKEDFVPKGTGQFMHSLAPFLAIFPVLVSFAVIPFGPPLRIGGREITLQLADLNIGILFVFAFISLAVYGTVLGGWVSQNKFALLGSLRASAQMISYEITMGISIIGVLAIYQTLDLNEIVRMQSGTTLGVLPRWGIFLSPFNWIAFILFFVSVIAETKRVPFDLPESESELVAGYFTEYSGIKFLLFWLGEFAEIVVASALVVVLFFGGWQIPYFEVSSLSWGPLIGAAAFGLKVAFFCVLQVVIRWTLPRFRYDQMLGLCWKLMLPLAVLNMLATTAFFLWNQS